MNKSIGGDRMRGKYETHVKPKLDLIAQWARDGAI